MRVREGKVYHNGLFKKDSHRPYSGGPKFLGSHRNNGCIIEVLEVVP